ncbi:MAG TPA: alginate export family protein [Candidatus Bathyarchaeia archaeon]|nr:alginate export family protein [Candidatus Bathyarchaeia archaeon]
MRKSLMVLIVAALAMTAMPSFAELQNVMVGGQIRIRGNWFDEAALPDSAVHNNRLFQWSLVNWRPGILNPLAGARWFGVPGRAGVGSLFSWDDRGGKLSFTEMRTRLNVRADFTEMVSAFIELDSYDIWGEDFRSDYVTGVDRRAGTGDDVEMYQAYIEANEMFGFPLRLRIGRQEMNLGSGWLIGTNDEGPYFRGLSFDAVRATYKTDMFSVDAFWAKLADFSPLEEDGDIDLYGVYASYLGVENSTFDAYWLLVRDAISRQDTQGGWLGDWVENLLSVDDYDPTYLHTVGLRGAGKYGAFDFEAEAAYQFGNADAVNRGFAGQGLLSAYGPDGETFGAWGGNLEVGYTFDMEFQPRVFIGGAYLGGEDNRDVDFVQWLGAMFCPFWSADSSLSFNRLFSNWKYSNFLDSGVAGGANAFNAAVGSAGADLSNVWLARAGLSVMPTEQLRVEVTGTYYEALEAFNSPWPTFWLLGNRVSPLAGLTFFDQENDKALGWEVAANVTYIYSEDLSFELGYAHFFVDDGLEWGNFNNANGLLYNGGQSDEDPNYVYFQTKICF